MAIATTGTRKFVQYLDTEPINFRRVCIRSWKHVNILAETSYGSWYLICEGFVAGIRILELIEDFLEDRRHLPPIPDHTASHARVL